MTRTRELTEEDKKLANRIRGIRIEKGIKQEALSILIDKNPNYMAYVETGRRGLSLPTLYKLAKALKRPIKDLFS